MAASRLLTQAVGAGVGLGAAAGLAAADLQAHAEAIVPGRGLDAAQFTPSARASVPFWLDSARWPATHDAQGRLHARQPPTAIGSLPAHMDVVVIGAGLPGAGAT